jgi:UDP-N-acetylglucosamine 2-epimerase (non-hydrolysing)
MKVMCVVGARPNFMKIAPIMTELRKRGHRTVLVHTGQHYDAQMSDAFFSELGIANPDFNLGVGSGTQAEQLSRIVAGFEPVLLSESPDWVVVVGDVTSTLAASLVTVKLKPEIGCRLAHVEAGLRSRDWRMPEEINRVVTDRVSDLLLTPSHDADENLKQEGIPQAKVRFVGNIMIDTLLSQLPAARKRGTAASLGLGGQFALVTLHRPSNVDDPEMFTRLMRCLQSVSSVMPVVFPMHPRTRAQINERGLQAELEGIRVVEPLTYQEMISLSDAAAIVLTDSGGVQEETTVLGVPCITLREQTERPITISEGTNTLAKWPPEPDEILRLVKERAGKRNGPDVPRPEGWDGRTAGRIVSALEEHLKVQ